MAGSLTGETILITGGAGFVGSNLTRRCLELGATVRVLDDFSTGNPVNLPASERLVVLRGSVTDTQQVAEAVAGVPTIIHAAARNIIASTRNPREDFETNIGGTLNVLMAGRAAGARRIVYTSSASIYGNPRHMPINEDDGINLLSPYAVSKFAGESYCRAFYESFGLSTAVVRYSNVYGPGQRSDNPYCGVVAKFFESALSGAAINVHGDGAQTRDFTYVDDAVEATILAALSPKAEGQVYNVGTGTETSVNDLVRMIGALCGSAAEPVYIDRRDIDNIRRRVVNIEKIRRELRWAPQVTIARGLKRTHAWLTEGRA